jgi:hypothetical protein
MINSAGPHQMQSVYVHLGPEGTSIPLPVTDSFWQDIGSGVFDHLGPVRLLAQMEFTESWSSWEMHPGGEEIVCLLSGAVEFILAKDGVERSMSLKAPGSYVIVPRGA